MKAARLLVCGLVGAAGLGLTSTAAAFADSGTGPCGDVGCASPQVPGQPQNGPLHDPGTVADTSTSSGGLAFTGSDIAGLTLFAFGAVAVGSALRWGSRRSHDEPARS